MIYYLWQKEEYHSSYDCVIMDTGITTVSNQDDFAWTEESFSNEKMIDVQSCMFSIILLQLPYFGMICIWLEELNKVEHYYISYSDNMQYDYANMLMDYSCAHRSI